MNELSGLLEDATKAIESQFFRVQIDGGLPVFRERVYCYELYHQLRQLWPKNCPHTLHGELDKSAHPKLRKLTADKAIPDLLVHTPGAMSGNCAIIEVKHSTNKAGIRKDLRILNLFCQSVGYKKAIYLFFGDIDRSELKRKIDEVANEFPSMGPIEVWLHAKPGNPAQLFLTIRGPTETRDLTSWNHTGSNGVGIATRRSK